MRLIHTKKPETGLFQIVEFSDDHIPTYAILSHTWEEEEVSFRDIHGHNTPPFAVISTKKGYAKIWHACAVSRQAGYDWLWVDTCCIDKTSSAELSEAINSMYRWYQQADVCYAYLADVTKEPGELLPNSRWFTRGFTLQELVAPSEVIFLNATWHELGSKKSLQQLVSSHTGIPEGILSGKESLDSICIAQRMSWAAGRKTSRIEDRAYSLLGLFGINMPLLYGEGHAAFIRLQEEIIRISDDASLFAWQSNALSCGLLATSPDAFKDCADVIILTNPLINTIAPWTITNRGIHIELPFLPVGRNGLGWAILQCSRRGKEDRFLAVYLRDIYLTMEQFERVWCNRLESVDLRRFQLAQFPVRQVCVRRRQSALHVSGINEPETAMEFEQGVENELFYWNPTLYKDSDLIDLANSAYERKLSATVNAAERGDEKQVHQSLKPHDTKASIKDIQASSLLLRAVYSSNLPLAWLLLARNDLTVNLEGANSHPFLSQAAKHGHLDILWLLLSRSDTNAYPVDEHGLGPVHFAVRNGQSRILKIFLARNDMRNHMKDFKGRSLLSHAAECGHLEIARIILTQVDTQPDIEDEKGWTPLFWATVHGKDQLCDLLLDHGSYIDRRDKIGRSPLWHAVGCGQEGVCELLISRGAALDTCDDRKRTPLHQAVISKSQTSSLLLLTKGADVDPTDDTQYTPLLRAAMIGNLSICRILIDHGADINIRDPEGRSPVWYAAMLGHKDVTDLLIRSGADAYSRVDRHRNSPLEEAIRNGQRHVLWFYTRDTADVESKVLGSPALRCAVEDGDAQSVTILRYFQANPSPRDSLGRIPLHIAAMNGNEEIVRILLVGADIEAKDLKGKTALHWAVEAGQTGVVGTLVENGADVHSKDLLFRTPLDQAQRLDNAEILELLLSKSRQIESERPASQPGSRGILQRLQWRT